MASQNEWAVNPCAAQKNMQVGRDGDAVLRRRSGVTPATPRAVVDTDRGVPRHRRRDPSPVSGGLTQPRLEDDRWRTGADALQMEPMPADVDQLSRRRIRATLA